MRIGVIGINHKLANVKLRELLAKACQKRFFSGSSIHGEHSFVLLSTCNRTEVYFTSEDLANTHTYLLYILRNEIDDDFDQKVYSYFGKDCFSHLSRVTSGLDSAILAETEIQGQVKAAYENAIQHLQLPSELHYLFQKALKIGKQVRADLFHGRVMPELEHAIFNTGMHLFKTAKEANILFIGASDINQKILGFLQNKQIQNITICNRTLGRAQEIAKKHKIALLEWDKLAQWHDYNWIIFGTKSSEYLIAKSDLPPGIGGQKLIIDLCVPRNVDPKLGRDPRVTLLNIDQINRILKVRKQKMAHTLSQAEEVVSHAAQLHIDLYCAKENSRLYSPQLSLRKLG